MMSRAGLPRWTIVALAMLVLLVVIPAVDFGVPWGLSLLTARHGWRAGRPGAANWIGLIPIVIGEAGVLWFAVTGIRHLPLLPPRITNLKPQVLMTSGPFAYTRNPRYLFAATLWFGQSVFYGSISSFLGFAALAAIVWLLVPREERTLEAQFGEEYRRYKAKVPRWIIRRPR